MSSNQQFPPRPPSSPRAIRVGLSSSPRSISFVSNASPPSSRPMTSSGRKSSDASGYEGLGKGAEGTATTKAGWTDAQEDRLVLVQAELLKAQKRWSESQEIWLEEEHSLLELKEAHKKALKKESVIAKKAAGTWRAKSLRRPRLNSLRSSRMNSEDTDINNHDGAEGCDGVNSDTDSEEDEAIGRTVSHELSKSPSHSSTLSTAIRRLSFSVRSRRNTSTGNGTGKDTPNLSSSLPSRVNSREESPGR